MSSEDDSDNGFRDQSSLLGHENTKRRKLIRACDVCRRRKIRCDASEKAESKCSHCTAFKLECTFNEGSRKRGPPKGYVDDLERRCQDLEILFRRFAPQVDITAEIGPSFTKATWASLRGNLHRPQLSAHGGPAPKPHHNNKDLFMRHTPGLPSSTTLLVGMGKGREDPNPESHALDSEDEVNYPGPDSLARDIAKRLERVHITSTGFNKRFHGKSSGITLVQLAMNFHDEVTKGNDIDPVKFPARNTKGWQPNPWEIVAGASSAPADLDFPPQDLADILVKMFFERFTTMYPIVHQPTFERSREAGLHLKDMDFAKLYLLVCANGARFAGDPRACFVGPTGNVEWNSAGWTWFVQVLSITRPIIRSVSLSELQATALLSLYLQGTSAPHHAWLVSGLGLRFAQDIGAHREKVYSPADAFENQLWKRAFWSLVAIDRMNSASLGRPTSVHDEDIDAELPLEVDDDCYDNDLGAWIQPKGKPSKLSAFCHYIKIAGIVAYTMRTIYSINRSKTDLGFVGPEWESHTVAELDSALNSWFDGLPNHLIWDPNIEDPFLFQQAAILRLTYYYAQITLHRPFISTMSVGSRLSFPSLAICTNAARSSSRILEVYVGRGNVSSPVAHGLAFNAGVLLIISIWGVRKNRLKVDVTSQIADVHRCIKALHQLENTFHTASKFCDILKDLAAMVEATVPERPTPTMRPAQKRPRDSEADDADVGSESTAIRPHWQSDLLQTPSESAVSVSRSSEPTASGSTAPSYTNVDPKSPGYNVGGDVLTMLGLDSTPAPSLWSSAVPGIPTAGSTIPWDHLNIGGIDMSSFAANLSQPQYTATDLPGSDALFTSLLGTFAAPANSGSGSGSQPFWNVQDGIDDSFGWLDSLWPSEAGTQSDGHRPPPAA